MHVSDHTFGTGLGGSGRNVGDMQVTARQAAGEQLNGDGQVTIGNTTSTDLIEADLTAGTRL